MSAPLSRLGFFLVIGVLCGACRMFPDNRGAVHFRQANQLYQQQEYKAAADEFERALQYEPTLTAAYFFLGNCYDNLYERARKGDGANDALLEKAVQYYSKAAETEQDAKIKKLALEYLVAAYGPDKLDDPTQAAPIVQRMIELDPKDPLNYFALAKIYEDAGHYEEAEATLIQARHAKPNDTAVYIQLALYYNRRGEFARTVEALDARAQLEPNNPEAHYTLATYYWDKAYRDARLPDSEKKKYIDSGMEAVDKAIELKGDYMEALVHKTLLLRLQADLERNPARQQELLKEADELRDRAQELRKQKAAGVGD